MWSCAEVLASILDQLRVVSRDEAKTKTPHAEVAQRMDMADNVAIACADNLPNMIGQRTSS